MKICSVVAIAASLGLAVSAWAQSDQPGVYRATPLPPGERPPTNPPPTDGPGFDMDWNTIDNSGGPLLDGGLELDGTVGQPDAGAMTAGDLELIGGYWSLVENPVACYANCDDSTVPPILNINDFQCFLNKFASGDTYANCDNSTNPPVLNANDFQCFMNKFAAGCS